MTMQSDSIGEQKYFDRVSKQWDALYSHENPHMLTQKMFWTIF
jgi:hypothetical protein